MQELFLAEGSDRLKLMVLYSGEEDEKLRRAASGTLAMLTALHPPICKRIPQVVSAPRRGEGTWCPVFPPLGCCGRVPVLAPGARTTCPDPSLPPRRGRGCRGAVGVGAERGPPPPQTVHWLEILQALLLSPSAELQHRGAVVVMNMVAAGRELAEQLVASETLEILSVLAKDRDKPRVAQAAEASLARAVAYGLIQPAPGRE